MVVSHRAVYFAIFAFFYEYSYCAYSQCFLSVMDSLLVGCVGRLLILTAQAACTPLARLQRWKFCRYETKDGGQQGARYMLSVAKIRASYTRCRWP